MLPGRESGQEQCEVMTQWARLCADHLSEQQGLGVRQSQISSAGFGLFATRLLPKGHEMPLTGDIVDMPNRYYGGRFVVVLREAEAEGGRATGLDAARLNTALARFINDAEHDSQMHPSLHVNCQLKITQHAGRNNCLDAAHRTASYVTIRAIEAGEELLASYGSRYWEAVGKES